jgi:hypothetical protein
VLGPLTTPKLRQPGATWEEQAVLTGFDRSVRSTLFRLIVLHSVPLCLPVLSRFICDSTLGFRWRFRVRACAFISRISLFFIRFLSSPIPFALLDLPSFSLLVFIFFLNYLSLPSCFSLSLLAFCQLFPLNLTLVFLVFHCFILFGFCLGQSFPSIFSSVFSFL